MFGSLLYFVSRCLKPSNKLAVDEELLVLNFFVISYLFVSSGPVLRVISWVVSV